VVELMARFDEASNIRWARSMEDAGVQVFHGVVGLKTHCKLAMLVRRDEDGVTRRYCHLGTGNYNPVTARFYTDLSLLTSDPQITERVHMVFNYLTAHAEIDDYSAAAGGAADHGRELSGPDPPRAGARAGRPPAHIVAKMNALLEPSVIEALYQASQAGVEIDLIVRGLSILRPGVKGLSERIRVRSIVGRFLEHSRIFHFANGGPARSILARPTGCRATCSSAARSSSRCATRRRWRAFTTRFCPLIWPIRSRPGCSSPKHRRLNRPQNQCWAGASICLTS
jgi:polyphosphate kinase